MMTKLALTLSSALVLLCAGLTLIPMQEEGVDGLEFLGSFHPMVLHLPIGLWVGVLILLAWRSRSKKEEPLLFWGGVVTVITGVMAFLSGLNLYWAGGYAKETLQPHMYGALAFLIGAVIFCYCCHKNKGYVTLWVAALGSMVALGAAGHVGGVITHGDPLEKAPWVVAERRQAAAEQKAAEEAAALANDGSVKNPEVYKHLVGPILEEKCVNCHSSERAKGKLRMDSYAALIQGGSKGASLKPGDAAGSLMLERVHLPLENKEHMPPKDKPQVSPQELALLEWWVQSGASERILVTEADIPDEHSALVETLIGGDPEAIRRREQKELEQGLIAIYTKVSQQYPGIITQSLQGEAKFEINSASLYAMDEEQLRVALEPLLPHVVRLDWTNRPLEPAWFELFLQCERLATLNLSLSESTDEQVKTLVQRNLPLDKLNLYGVPVTDALVAVLQEPISAGQLSSLIIGETEITAQGRLDLRNAIPQTSIID